MYALIMGAGWVGQMIASNLTDSHEVAIGERDPVLAVKIGDNHSTPPNRLPEHYRVPILREYLTARRPRDRLRCPPSRLRPVDN